MSKSESESEIQIDNAVSTIVAALDGLTAHERSTVLARVAERADVVTPFAAALGRDRVEEAVRSSATLPEAASKLGCSRRSLQRRMRELGMPAGKDGRRPKSLAQ